MTEEKKSSTIRLRGLPFTAEEADIREFLGDGFDITNVYITKKNNRNSGEAYVRFANAEMAAAARQEKDKETMGTRYIEIFEVRDGEEPLMPDPDDTTKGFVLRLRGLPFSATEADIREFFKDIELSNSQNAIVIATSPVDRKPTGEAYVEFSSEAAQVSAMQRNKEKMGERYIELFPSSRGDLVQQLHTQQAFHRVQQGVSKGGRGRQPSSFAVPISSPAVAGVRAASGPQAATDGSTIRLRGLPFNATVDDIIDFFEGFKLDASNIELVPKFDQTGRSTPQCNGIAFVQFESPEAARHAREAKHKKNIGSRYIECMPHSPARPLQPPPAIGYQHAQAYAVPASTPQRPHARPPGGPMHTPPGPYGPAAGLRHVQQYGHMPPQPPAAQGAQGMAPTQPSGVPGGRGTGRGRMGQANAGRGGGAHLQYQQHMQGQAVEYQQQGFAPLPHGYYQQQPLQQPPPQQFAQQQHAQWGPVREETAWTPAGGPGVSTWGMPPPQSSAKYDAPFQGGLGSGGATGGLDPPIHVAYGSHRPAQEHAAPSGAADEGQATPSLR